MVAKPPDGASSYTSMNSQLYSTGPFKKRCRQASHLYCMTKESTKCDLFLLFACPQMEWCGRKEAFSFPPMQKLKEGPANFCPDSPGAAAYQFPQAQGRRKGQKQDSRCCFAFLSSCMNKTCLVSWSWCHGTHAMHLPGAPKACCFTQLPSHHTIGHPFPAKGSI